MRTLITIALCTPALLLTGCGSSVDDSAAAKERSTHSVDLAYSICDWGDEDSGTMRLGDGKHTLVIEGFSGDELASMWECVSNVTQPSDELTAEVDSTNSLMGRQKEKSNDKTYTWSYHPDNGLDMTITEPDYGDDPALSP